MRPVTAKGDFERASSFRAMSPRGITESWLALKADEVPIEPDYSGVSGVSGAAEGLVLLSVG